MVSATKNSKAAATAQTTQPNVQTVVSNALSSADSVVIQRLQTFTQLHQARIARLTRAAASLSAQGAASAASLAQTQAQIAAEQTTVAKVAIVNQQTATAAPQVAASGWALHGRVYSSDLAPVASYTVFLVDTQNAYQSANGFTYTDASGYFLLNAANVAAAPTGASATGAAAAAAPQLFVSVADAKGEPVYRSPSAFTPVVGSATYQNHVLPAGGKPIGDPPASIRDIALPKT